MKRSRPKEYCVACGRRRGAADFVCAACSGAFFSSRLDPRVTADREAALGLRKLGGPLETLPGLPAGDVLLLHGSTGSGKSTLALQCFRRPIVLSTEMAPSLILAYGARLGVEVAAVADVELDADELGVPIASAHLADEIDADGVILDSLNGVGAVEVVYQAALQIAAERDLPLVVVAQHTADDKIRGGEHVPHMGHIIAEVRQVEGGGREICVTKNRFGPVVTIPFVLAGEQAQRGYYYVVEGRRGAYKMSAYPWVSSPVWEAVEAGKLSRPPAPAAAAARQSPIYGGWVEPPDQADRAAFARSRGVPYFSPVGAPNAQ